MTNSILVDRPRDGVAIVYLPTELDTYVAPALREQLAVLLFEGRKDLIAYAEDVRKCDSTCLAVLVGANKKAEARGGAVVWAAPSPQMRDLLTTTGLERSGAVKVYATLDEARGAAPEVAGAPSIADWPTPQDEASALAQPPAHVPDDVRHIAVQVCHAAAEEAVKTMVEAEFAAWLHDLELDTELLMLAPDEGRAVITKLWRQIAPMLTGALITVTFPQQYIGQCDPTAVDDDEPGTPAGDGA